MELMSIFTDYGQLTNVFSFNEYAEPGIGTYNAYISSGNLNVEFFLNSIDYTYAKANVLAFEMNDR